MKKRVLIAVDGSLHADQGLVYVADLVSGRDDIGCTLIHVQPMISKFFAEEAKADPKVQETLQRVMEYNQRQSTEILDKSKQMLLGRGVPPSAVEVVGKPRAMGLAKDILEHAHTNGFDVIVAGRRGLARVQKIFMGSVSSKLAEYSGGIPVWVVDGDIRPRKFLVALDVMAPWAHTLDHLTAMCAGRSDLQMTFYHVMQNEPLDEATAMIPGMQEIGAMIARNEKDRLDQFWEEAKERLAAAGFNRRHLDILAPLRTGRIGKMITQQAESGSYDTVLIGRRGGDQAYYFGSISRYVIERLSDCAVWVLG